MPFALKEQNVSDVCAILWQMMIYMHFFMHSARMFYLILCTCRAAEVMQSFETPTQCEPEIIRKITFARKLIEQIHHQNTV